MQIFRVIGVKLLGWVLKPVEWMVTSEVGIQVLKLYVTMTRTLARILFVSTKQVAVVVGAVKNWLPSGAQITTNHKREFVRTCYRAKNAKIA